MSERRRKKTRVLLLCPPWGRVDMPSLSGATAATLLRERGVDARVRYLTLELAARLGGELYEELSDGAPFIGQALFAADLPGQEDAAERRPALARSIAERDPQAEERRLLALAERAAPLVADFLSEWTVEPVDRAVFVCERDTLNQSIPAAVLARRLKLLRPSCRVALVGAAFEGPVGPEYLRAFPWLDAVLVGDIEVSLPAWLAGDASGVLKRGAAPPPPPIARSLDDLPIPDFEDYFNQRRAARGKGLLVPEVILPFEGSRGCWWGERSHCLFCNLNDQTIAGRAKSPVRLLDELRLLSSRHKTFRFSARDNILPQGYVEELLPRLAELDLRIFYELKPRLDRRGVAALAAAGIVEVQPGIETFSSRLLKVWGKGGTAMQNAAFMKWCRHYGVELRYFLIHGSPEETTADYERVLSAVEALAHLQPPLRLRRLDLARHSPYFDLADRFGLRGIRPMPELELVLPSPALDWSRAAHWFDHDGPRSPALERRAARLSAAVDRWRELWSRPVKPSFEVRKGAGFVELFDARRANGSRRVIRLEGDDAWLYESCEEPRSAAELERRAREAGRRPRAASIESSLRSLAEDGLVFEDSGNFLALALPFRRRGANYDMIDFYSPRTLVETENAR